MISAYSASEQKDFCIITVKALQNIDNKEELYVKYGSAYSFTKAVIRQVMTLSIFHLPSHVKNILYVQRRRGSTYIIV